MSGESKDYERFLARIQHAPDGSGCWLWTKAMSFWSSRDRTLMTPRRWILEYMHGEPVPADHIVRARCGNKRCVMPDHLYLVWKGTRDATHCSRGHVLDEVNGYWTSSGSWVCRPCKRDYMRTARQNEEFRRRQREHSATYQRRHPERYREKLARNRRRYAEDLEYRQRQLDNTRRRRSRDKAGGQLL